MKRRHQIVLLAILLTGCGEVKQVSTTGTSFGHDGWRKDCIIDGNPVTCSQMRKAFRKYKRTIRKCNTKWLVQYDYNGNKVAEGYAVRSSIFSHHHYWIAEKISYSENGDTLTHQIDTTVNIDNINNKPAFILRKITPL